MVTNPNTGRYYTAGCNVANAPLDNKLVRQALNYAMNRQRFVDTVLLGLSRPVTLPWISTSPAYDSATANYFTFDLDKAKALLAQAGVGPFSLEYLISPNFPELSTFGQIYQADLATLGVTLSIKQTESAAFFTAINNRTYPGMFAITSARADLHAGYHHPVHPGVQPRPQQRRLLQRGLQRTCCCYVDGNRRAEAKAALCADERHAGGRSVRRGARVRLTSHAPHKQRPGLAYTMHEGFVWTNVWLA